MYPGFLPFSEEQLSCLTSCNISKAWCVYKTFVVVDFQSYSIFNWATGNIYIAIADSTDIKLCCQLLQYICYQ